MAETTLSTILRLGVDIEVNTDDEEIVCHHYRVNKIENISKCIRLKKLTIVASCVDTIEGLDDNLELEDLEIYQGMISVIPVYGIGHLVRLKVLDLSFNNIKKIENIGSLICLEKLYLSNNKIEKIEGLENLNRLKVLELGSNRIRKIV